MGQLACGAFFYGMRSCEYLSISGTRKTKRFKVRNIRFFKNNVEIKDKRGPLLKYTDTVSITFESQKNGQKNITVTQPRSGKVLCPVIMWSCIVQRILGYEGASEKSPVNLVLIGGKRHYVTRNEMLKHLSNTVDNMDGLGFIENMLEHIPSIRV